MMAFRLDKISVFSLLILVDFLPIYSMCRDAAEMVDGDNGSGDDDDDVLLLLFAEASNNSWALMENV